MSDCFDMTRSSRRDHIVFERLANSHRPTPGQLSKLTAALAISALAFALLVSTASASSTTAYLNSYNATDSANNGFCIGPSMVSTTPPGCGSTVTVPVVLASGTSYTVKVSGAVSPWGSWTYRRCGKPEPNSEYPSPGITNKPASDDAQFRFAAPRYTGRCVHPLPQKAGYFQVNLGGGWYHPIANGEPSKPSTDNGPGYQQHPYTFTFTGQGVAPEFRYVDYHPSDNSGQFKIVVEGGPED